MANELAREVAGRRFAAEAPGLSGVMGYGETAEQAEMRAAVVALRVKVFGADCLYDRAADRQWHSAVIGFRNALASTKKPPPS